MVYRGSKKLKARDVLLLPFKLVTNLNVVYNMSLHYLFIYCIIIFNYFKYTIIRLFLYKQCTTKMTILLYKYIIGF